MSSKWNFFRFDIRKISFRCIDFLIPIHFFIFVTKFVFHAVVVCHLCCCECVLERRTIPRPLVTSREKCHGGAKQQTSHGTVNFVRYLENMGLNNSNRCRWGCNDASSIRKSLAMHRFLLYRWHPYLGGKQGAKVCIRGASIRPRCEGQWHISRGSESRSSPQKLTNFRWP